jgi:hypothetical protein
MAYYLLGRCAVTMYKKKKDIEDVVLGKCPIDIVELYDDEEIAEKYAVELTKKEVDWVIKIQKICTDESGE